MTHDHAAQRRFAVDVLEKLRAAGHTAYWAGGCVRDELLGLIPKDYDVATSARPEQVRDLFGKRRTLAVGAAFGVIVVVGPREAGTVEVATFRRDADYSDGRRPDAVVFTDAEEDARRRDFTMNALFYDPTRRQVIDYVGGRDDLERKLVRAVGDARLRFQEDKLRMLRGVRMASTFGFALDGDTRAAIEAAAHEILVVSPERIAQEVRGMFNKRGAATAVGLLLALGLARAILPEFHELSAEHQSLGLAVLELLDRHAVFDPAVVLAALLFQTPEAAATANAVLRRWRMSNDEREQVVWLVKNIAALEGAAEKKWSALQPLLAHEWGGHLVTLAEARAAATEQPLNDVKYCREKLGLPRGELDPPPLVTGDDLVRHGLKPGREFAGLLQAARSAQLDGEVRTAAEAIALVDRLRAG